MLEGSRFSHILFIAAAILYVGKKVVIAKSDKEIELKNKFTCRPPEEQNLIDYNERIIDNACVEKSYSASEPPDKNNLTKLVYFISDSTISEVDERKKTIAIDIKMSAIWEDSRIRATFVTADSGGIKLPPVVKDKTPIIWTPFLAETGFKICRLKNIKYTLGTEIVSYVKILSNNISNLEDFSPNSTLVVAVIEWKVTVSCPFKFSQFPFDNQKCDFKIEWSYVNPTPLENGHDKNKCGVVM